MMCEKYLESVKMNKIRNELKLEEYRNYAENVKV